MRQAAALGAVVVMFLLGVAAGAAATRQYGPLVALPFGVLLLSLAVAAARHVLRRH